MFLWLVFLAVLAFYFGGIRRALRDMQGPRIVLDVCAGAPIFWTALWIHGVTFGICVVAAVLGYLHVRRGGELPGLWLDERAFR